MSDIMIPRPIQIILDDLGWFCGDDDRKNGGASRSGMPRRHCYKDYEAIHMLGKAIDQKITCAFCLGEWDPDNRLKDLFYISKYGNDWDNAKFYDKEEVKRCVDTINSSPYIEFSIHGIGHGYYSEDNENPDVSDFYKKIDKKYVSTGEEYTRKIFDSFFDLMKYHGIEKEVKTFIFPSGAFLLDDISKQAKEYGIKYFSNPFRMIKCEYREVPTDVCIDNGIILLDRSNDLGKWNQCDIDYSEFELKKETYGAHWPNFLHSDPDQNEVVVKSAIKYFYRCAEQQEAIISRDIAFYATQTMFWKHAEMTEKGDETVIDLTNVPRLDSMNDVFYVNSRFPLMTCYGGKMSEYDRKKGFITYEIKPEKDVIILK